MTAREFQVQFETAASFIDKVKNGDIRIDAFDINYFLNEGYDSFVNKRLENLKNKIEGKQRDIDKIKNLEVVNTALTKDGALSTANYSVYTLPTNYRYLLNDRTITTYCSSTGTYPNRLSPYGEVYNMMEYTHTKSKYNSPISTLNNNKLYIHNTSDFTISGCYIDYIKNPTPIDVTNNVTCELDSSVHKEILNLAVNIFLEAIQSDRFKTNIEKNIISEQIK